MKKKLFIFVIIISSLVVLVMIILTALFYFVQPPDDYARNSLYSLFHIALPQPLALPREVACRLKGGRIKVAGCGLTCSYACFSSLPNAGKPCKSSQECGGTKCLLTNKSELKKLNGGKQIYVSGGSFDSLHLFYGSMEALYVPEGCSFKREFQKDNDVSWWNGGLIIDCKDKELFVGAECQEFEFGGCEPATEYLGKTEEGVYMIRSLEGPSCRDVG